MLAITCQERCKVVSEKSEVYNTAVTPRSTLILTKCHWSSAKGCIPMPGWTAGRNLKSQRNLQQKAEYPHRDESRHSSGKFIYLTEEDIFTQLRIHHVMYRHEREKLFKCDLCTFRSARQLNLDRHWKS